MWSSVGFRFGTVTLIGEQVDASGGVHGIAWRETMECDCSVMCGRIIRCPLHAAAPCLLKALEDIMQVIATDELMPESVSYMKQARAAIKAARGGKDGC